MNTTPKVIRIEGHTIEPITGKPENIVKGNPITVTRNVYDDKTNTFSSGIWSASEGKWEFVNPCEEFCYFIKGKVKMTSIDGDVQVFYPGDAFVIPVNWSGSWEVIEPVTKYYVVMSKL